MRAPAARERLCTGTRRAQTPTAARPARPHIGISNGLLHARVRPGRAADVGPDVAEQLLCRCLVLIPPAPDGSQGARSALTSGLTLSLAASSQHVAQHHRGCRWAAQPVLMCRVSGTAGAAQAATWCPASRARSLGGGCGSSPSWVRIFSMTGRSRIAAMILSSPPPQFGQCSTSSMSKAKLQRRLTCTQVMSRLRRASTTAPS